MLTAYYIEQNGTKRFQRIYACIGLLVSQLWPLILTYRACIPLKICKDQALPPNQRQVPVSIAMKKACPLIYIWAPCMGYHPSTYWVCMQLLLCIIRAKWLPWLLRDAPRICIWAPGAQILQPSGGGGQIGKYVVKAVVKMTPDHEPKKSKNFPYCSIWFLRTLLSS